MDRGGAGSLRAGTDRVYVAIEEDLAVGVLPLELGDAAEDVFKRGRFVIRVDPQMNRLLGSHGRMDPFPA